MDGPVLKSQGPAPMEADQSSGYTSLTLIALKDLSTRYVDRLPHGLAMLLVDESTHKPPINSANDLSRRVCACAGRRTRSQKMCAPVGWVP